MADMDESVGAANELTYEEKVARASIIAKPMASKKLAKKLFKLIRKASKQKNYLRSGLKIVQARIRKGERGLVIFAGNACPVEVICHLPGVCEDKGMPYAYVPTGKDLGVAMGVKRCCLVVMIRPHEDYQELYDEMVEEVKLLPPPESVEA
ncbi:H/ACA ribonucleoprotein complex subunit 2-like protein [Orchesella cincta]|uniref:H/ACA ribonucleoprotein complex subunit 2-like protein n=1 Tax=Orchesella cincta TaxID=48709 RepID=A0A1D2N9U8_ORCCI|nr:H/ACA ribonucleoprotein complex subunit 2-like protein [Orchesella cincta]